MFIAPAPDSTRMICFRSDDEMAQVLDALSASLRTTRSTLCRIAVLKLIQEARAKQPTYLQEILHADR
jgi:predicted transcriptional regulator